MKAHPRLEEHTNFMVDHQAEKSSWWVLCELSDAVLEDVLIDGSGLAKFHLHINALEGNHSLNDCPFEAHRSEVSFPRASRSDSFGGVQAGCEPAANGTTKKKE